MNMVVARPPEGAAMTEGLTEKELASLASARQWRDEETGYQAIQGTKPQTLAYGLSDSPAGLRSGGRRSARP